jgi:hypothetical protein
VQSEKQQAVANRMNTTVVHQIVGRYQIAAHQKNLTLERFGRNSK